MPAGKCAFECVLYEIVGAFLIAAQQCVGEAAQPRYLRLEQSDELIALQRDIKRAFDPKDLLNPGKIFPTDGGHRAC